MAAKYWSINLGKGKWGVKGDPEYVYEGAILPLTKPETGFKFRVRVVEIVRHDRNHVVARTEHVRVWGESSRPVERQQEEMPAPVRRVVPQDDALW